MNYCLEVTGDFACFTRPEMKVERVSYDIMTPSAARAIFESILWKPAIQWNIRKIEVLNPIRWFSIRRNEVSGVLNGRAKQGSLAQYIEDERQQRAALLLRDVAYRIYAELEVRYGAGVSNPPIKYREMFERRASKGQCVNQPYLGCREFASRFRWIVAPEDEPVDWSLLDESSRIALGFSGGRDLGYMLYDMDFSNTHDPKPLFFRAQLEEGVLHVPDRMGGEVRG